jgi:hypothetical protein
MIKYFHQLTEQEFLQIRYLNINITYEELERLYPQPVWCTYPQAIYGILGCHSLTTHRVINETYCNTCNYSRNVREPEDVENEPVWD